MVSQDYNCLFGKLHVRLATTCIGIFSAILGGTIPVAEFGGRKMESICGPLNLVVGIMTIYGSDRLRPKFLYPLIVQCVLSTGILCVFLVFNTIYIIDKSSFRSEDQICLIGQMIMLAPQLYVESRNFDIVSAQQVLGPVSIFFVLVFVFLNVWIGRVTYRCLHYVKTKSVEATPTSA
uniref:Solute carrier family 23 member 2 n=1 Tax=Steinernema glaseri TaxID=37863 RepID=A0A1I7Y0M9_9BILA